VRAPRKDLIEMDSDEEDDDSDDDDDATVFQMV
jgi:hypothetical protein